MRRYTTDSLYHFVGRGDPTNHTANVETLRLILRAKRISHPPHTPDWGTVSITFDPSKRLSRGELIVPNVVCFCDIPRDCLGIHMQKYGQVGLSLSRNHLLRYQGRPVHYFPYDPKDPMTTGGITALNDIEAVYRGLRKVKNVPNNYKRYMGRVPETMEDAIIAAESVISIEVVAFLKPYDATLAENDPNNFYMEREWRRLGNMQFEEQHVGYIIAPPPYIDSLRREFPEFAAKIVDTDSHANP